MHLESGLLLDEVFSWWYSAVRIVAAEMVPAYAKSLICLQRHPPSPTTAASDDAEIER